MSLRCSGRDVVGDVDVDGGGGDHLAADTAVRVAPGLCLQVLEFRELFGQCSCQW